MRQNLNRCGGMMRLAAACAVVGGTGLAWAGPDWLEQGDAGSTIFGAQMPIRPLEATSLTRIEGALSTAFVTNDYEDLYFIRVTDPNTFAIRPAYANFNIVMYLFNVTVNGEGYGLLGNNDESATSNLSKLTNRSDDGTEVIVRFPGDYVLAITGFGRTPVSRTGAIFNLATPTEISGPDGPGGINPLEDWTGVGETGIYGFELVATDFPRTPAPGGAVVLAVGGLLFTRRRR